MNTIFVSTVCHLFFILKLETACVVTLYYINSYFSDFSHILATWVIFMILIFPVLLHHNGNKYICDVHGTRLLIVLYFRLLQEHLGCVYKLLIILADEL